MSKKTPPIEAVFLKQTYLKETIGKLRVSCLYRKKTSICEVCARRIARIFGVLLRKNHPLRYPTYIYTQIIRWDTRHTFTHRSSAQIPDIRRSSVRKFERHLLADQPLGYSAEKAETNFIPLR